MNAGIEELEKMLMVYQKKLGEHSRELERLIEKKPIVERNIQDIEASIFVLKSMVED
ncbi:hypothetical protein U0X36_05520 [Bacillus thuringiensis]|uniref:hypothetical protein n=1 Tax=Bacillus thuringiensis TaxID=1428 RepID=UPI0015F30871|nr:hypothetical protein [Bacillus thuringiensis]MDZ3952403.1 hypothetical protein [Bacillus thuringiensis]